MYYRAQIHFVTSSLTPSHSKISIPASLVRLSPYTYLQQRFALPGLLDTCFMGEEILNIIY